MQKNEILLIRYPDNTMIYLPISSDKIETSLSWVCEFQWGYFSVEKYIITPDAIKNQLITILPFYMLFYLFFLGTNFLYQFLITTMSIGTKSVAHTAVYLKAWSSLSESWSRSVIAYAN